MLSSFSSCDFGTTRPVIKALKKKGGTNKQTCVLIKNMVHASKRIVLGYARVSDNSSGGFGLTRRYHFVLTEHLFVPDIRGTQIRSAGNTVDTSTVEIEDMLFCAEAEKNETKGSLIVYMLNVKC